MGQAVTIPPMHTKERPLALRLREAVDAGELGLWDLRPELEAIHCSPQWKIRLGFPEPQRADSTHFWRCRVHPDDLEGMLTAMRAHSQGSEPTYETRFRLRSNGSGYRRLHSRGRVIDRAADGRATRLLGTMLDLTPRPCTPQAGLPDGPRGAMAGVSPGQPFHLLLGAQGTGAAELHRLLALVDDLVRATLAQLNELRKAQ
jgi:PAS fold